MIGDTGLAPDSAPEPGAGADRVPYRRSRRRVRVRKQAKFSRPVRLMLWLGLPVLLWGGIYLAWRAVA